MNKSYIKIKEIENQSIRSQSIRTLLLQSAVSDGDTTTLKPSGTSSNKFDRTASIEPKQEHMALAKLVKELCKQRTN